MILWKMELETAVQRIAHAKEIELEAVAVCSTDDAQLGKAVLEVHCVEMHTQIQ